MEGSPAIRRATGGPFDAQLKEPTQGESCSAARRRSPRNASTCQSCAGEMTEWAENVRESQTKVEAAALEPSRSFVFVGFSDDRRLEVVI